MSLSGLKKRLSRIQTTRSIVCCLTACMLIWATLPCSALLASEQLTTAAVSDLKAVYIFNFIRFTDWPESRREQKQGRIRLNVLGDHAIYDVIKGISGKQPGRQMGLDVQACSTPSCLGESSVLFFGRSGSGRFQHLLESFKGKPVLTISDKAGFASRGGMIEIILREKKLGFIINLKAVKEANLYISAQLLQLADIIEGDQ